MSVQQLMLEKFDRDIPTHRTLTLERVPRTVATLYYETHHYLKSGRHGASLDYGVNLGSRRIGYLTFCFPAWHTKDGLVPPYQIKEVPEFARMCFGISDGVECQAVEMALKRMPQDWKDMTGVEPKVLIAYCNLLRAPAERDIYLRCGFKPWGYSHGKKSNKLGEGHIEYGKQKKVGIFVKSLAREWGR